MNEPTSRALLVAGLSANVLMLALAMIDYSVYRSEHMWPIFTSWGFLIVLIVVLAFVTSGLRLHVTHAPASAHASIHAPVAPAPVHIEHVVRATPAAKPAATGPFQFNGYTLYSREMELKGDGTRRTIYFFAKSQPKSGHPAPKPSGYHVGVNERTGLPFLKRGAGKDGEDLTPAAAEPDYRPQCSALTADGAQCRNSARAGSKYCGSHVGYQPKTLKGSAKKIEGKSWSPFDRLTDRMSVKKADVKPRVKGAKDTKPSVRKGFLGRFRRTSA